MAWTPEIDFHTGITSSVPAEVVALDLETYDVVHARRGLFMSALGRGNAGFECDCNPLTCCCAGFGMCRQTISGAPGTAFVQATGKVERKALKSGETLVVDSYSLVAWHDAALGVRPVGTCGALCGNQPVRGVGLISTQVARAVVGEKVAATRPSRVRARLGCSRCRGSYTAVTWVSSFSSTRTETSRVSPSPRSRWTTQDSQIL